MVLTSVMDSENFTTAPCKLRRSRRLSSTRGLRYHDTQSAKLPAHHQDFDRKLGTGSMAIEAVAGRTMNWELNDRISLSSGSSMGIEIHPDATGVIGISDRRRNDQESTDSKSQSNQSKTTSVRSNVPIKKTSRAMSKQTLELLNVSGFSSPKKPPINHSSVTASINGTRDRNVNDGNVIKSDSKYEIGVPGGECTMLRKKKKLPRPSCHRVTMTKPSKTCLKNDLNDLTGTASRRRWDISKDKVDKTNDSITKRLELIHDLNQKILANYERFQQKSKRPYGKNLAELDAHETPKNGIRKKDPEVPKQPRAVLSDLKDSYGNKEHIYSEITLKRKTKCRGSNEEPKQNTAYRMQEEIPDAVTKLGNDKFEQPKRCLSGGQATRSTRERLESLQNKSKSTMSRALRNLGGAPSTKAESKKKQQQLQPPGRPNENFSLAAKPEFRGDTKIPTGATDESPIKKLRSKFEEARSSVRIKTPVLSYARSNREQGNEDPHGRNHDSKKTNDGLDCLENSRLYPETSIQFCDSYGVENDAEVEERVSSTIDTDPSRILSGNVSDIKNVRESIDVIGETCTESTVRSDNRNELLESRRQEILEKEILDNLNETIGRFDNENDKTKETYADDGESCTGGSESFSTDSIQSTSPTSKPKTSVRAENTRLQETFNSSWDSGVGVDVGTGNGWVRIHTGIESSLVYLTLDTTAKDVCRDMLLGEDLSIFLQYGGEPSRRMGPTERPLEYQDEFLKELGYHEVSRRARLGVDPELRYLIAFHVGPTAPQPDLTGYSRSGYALVLKGLVFPQWKRRSLAVIGSRLFLYPSCPDSQPEWMELGGGGGAVCYAPSRLGKLVLRVTGFPRISNAQRIQAESRLDAHHQESRHLYLGFQHPWDRDLWRRWLKQVLHESFTCYTNGCYLTAASDAR